MMGHRALVELAGLEDLAPRRRERVRRHLADCQDCRDDLAFVRALRTTAGEVTAPGLPADGLARILARREAGSRVILPAGEPRAPRRRRKAVPIAIATTVLAAAAVAAQFAVRSLLHEAEPSGTATAPVPAAAVGIAIIPTSDTVDVRVFSTGRFRLEVLLHDGRELGVRGGEAAEGARFRVVGSAISVDDVTGGVVEVRIPHGVAGRVYVNDRLEVRAEARGLLVEQDGAVRDRVVLDVGH